MTTVSTRTRGDRRFERRQWVLLGVDSTIVSTSGKSIMLVVIVGDDDDDVFLFLSMSVVIILYVY